MIRGCAWPVRVGHFFFRGDRGCTTVPADIAPSHRLRSVPQSAPAKSLASVRARRCACRRLANGTSSRGRAYTLAPLTGTAMQGTSGRICGLRSSDGMGPAPRRGRAVSTLSSSCSALPLVPGKAQHVVKTPKVAGATFGERSSITAGWGAWSGVMGRILANFIRNLYIFRSMGRSEPETARGAVGEQLCSHEGRSPSCSPF